MSDRSRQDDLNIPSPSVGRSMILEAQALVADSPETIRASLHAVYRTFVDDAGCTPYVKTIYVGFEIRGVMVAAAYPHSTLVEVALALPEDASGERLVDATHLTWPTMPVAVEVSSPEDAADLRAYFDEAALRVRSQVHDVVLPTERFINRDRFLTTRPSRRR